MLYFLTHRSIRRRRHKTASIAVWLLLFREYGKGDKGREETKITMEAKSAGKKKEIEARNSRRCRVSLRLCPFFCTHFQPMDRHTHVFTYTPIMHWWWNERKITLLRVQVFTPCLHRSSDNTVLRLRNWPYFDWWEVEWNKRQRQRTAVILYYAR